MLAAIVLALGLAMDAVAAAAVLGLTAPRVRVRDAALVATLSGGFQGAMAALGWMAGAALGAPFARIDHWIAFALLLVLGGRTIVAGWRARATGGVEPAPGAARVFALGPLLVMAVATSIDALAAGVAVPLLAPAPAVTIALVGGITAVLAFGATYAGRAAGARLGAGLEMLGGVALGAIGIKILVEHLMLAPPQ